MNTRITAQWTAEIIEPDLVRYIAIISGPMLSWAEVLALLPVAQFIAGETTPAWAPLAPGFCYEIWVRRKSGMLVG